MYCFILELLQNWTVLHGCVNQSKFTEPSTVAFIWCSVWLEMAFCVRVTDLFFKQLYAVVRSRFKNVCYSTTRNLLYAIVSQVVSTLNTWARIARISKWAKPCYQELAIKFIQFNCTQFVFRNNLPSNSVIFRTRLPVIVHFSWTQSVELTNYFKTTTLHNMPNRNVLFLLQSWTWLFMILLNDTITTHK